ncbi:MAG: hypothetical protein DRI81_12690, partial [Chloroflexi bacterium]
MFSENTGLDHTIQLGIVLSLEIHVAAFSHKSANWDLTLLGVMAMSKSAALLARTPSAPAQALDQHEQEQLALINAFIVPGVSPTDQQLTSNSRFVAAISKSRLFFRVKRPARLRNRGYDLT